MKYLYIDCSKEYVHPGGTGIPRVVKQLITCSKAYTGQLTPIPVVHKQGSWYELPQQAQTTPSPKHSLYKINFIIKTLISYIPIINKLYPHLLYTFYNHHISKKEVGKKVEFKQGDSILFPDNFGLYILNKHARKLKEQGVTIGSLIHDVIPHIYPQFFLRFDVFSFNSLLTNIKNTANYIICVSMSVQTEVEQYLKEQNKHIPVSFFHLGHDFNKETKPSPISPNIQKAFTNKTFLVVSTFEPRKNQEMVVQAFTKLWDQGNKDHLVLIGRVGWKIQKTLKRIYKNKYLNKYLFIFHSVSDTELLYSYTNAHTLISPSIAEGFGLPIIEALSNNLHVIASDIPVHKEVGKDTCTYFNLSDQNSLIQAIQNIPNEKKNTPYTWLTWQQSFKMLLERIEKMLGI